MTMNSIKYVAAKFGMNERGTALMEYSMLLGVIAVAAIGAIVFAGDWVSDQWSGLQASLSSTTTTTTTTTP